MATIEWHLDNWARFMRVNKLRIGYPTKCLGFETGGSAGVEEFDHLADKCEITAAAEFDACVESLKPPRRCAIHHTYLGSKYTHTDLDMNLACAIIDLVTLSRRRSLNITQPPIL